jgi:Putative DNA-binding domain
MSDLLELQRRVAAAVMEPLTLGDKMRRRTRDGRSAESEANALIKPNSSLTSFERLEIYNRQYWFRILSSISEDFPGLRAVIGPRKFDRVIRAYLADCPSVSFTLRNLGSRLEEWLQNHLEFAAPNEQLALDMVRLEWAHVEAFDGLSLPVLTPADIETSEDDLKICLQPYVQLLRLNHEVDDLLIEVHTQELNEGASSNNAMAQRTRSRVRHYARPLPAEIYLAVHRLDNSVYYKRLGAEAFRILQGIRDGKELDEIVVNAFEGSQITPEQQPEYIQAWFETWAGLGWFTRSNHSLKQNDFRA